MSHTHKKKKFAVINSVYNANSAPPYSVKFYHIMLNHDYSSTFDSWIPVRVCTRSHSWHYTTFPSSPYPNQLSNVHTADVSSVFHLNTSLNKSESVENAEKKKQEKKNSITSFLSAISRIIGTLGIFSWYGFLFPQTNLFWKKKNVYCVRARVYCNLWSWWLPSRRFFTSCL